MFTRNLDLKALAFLTLSALAGCGSGSTVSSTSNQILPSSQLFMATSPNATLEVLRLDPATGLIVSETSTLTAPNALTGSALAGTVSYASTAGAENTILLNSDGSKAKINDQGQDYVFRFSASNGRIGVAGLPATNMPISGTAVYTGSADVIVNDGSGSPTFLTASSTTAFFGINEVNVVLDNTVDWIRINGADISGNTYSDGVLTVSSTFATDPVTSGALEHEGRFFETNAKEIGGVFILDRTDAGVTFKAQGVYSGIDGS